jgi:CelD/BcsL family acetyltransferase involved in cellulose biosynthesis
VSARVVPLAELGDRDLSAWRGLSDRAVEPNPFFDPDFVLAAADALGERGDVGVLVVEADGEWTGCLPVRHYRRWHRVPLPGVATWRHVYCFLGTPLVARGAEEKTMVAMVGALRRGGSSLCALEWVSARGALADAVAAALPPDAVLFESFERATLDRRPGAEEYLEGKLNSKHRRELRRLSRLLGEQLGGTPALADRAGDPDSVEAFLTMEAAGWKGEAGTALASNPEHAEFFRRVTAKFAARGALNLVFLEVDGTAVAATCDLVAGGVDFCFKVAYDERFSRFSPGRDLVFKMIDLFHEDRSLRTLDSCTAPDNDLYNRAWRDRRTVRTFAFGGKGIGGRLAPSAIRLGMTIRDRHAGESPAEAR